MNPRRLAIAALTAGILLAGCTPDTQPTQTPSTTPSAVASSAAPTPSPSPTASPSPTVIESFPDNPTTESPVQAEIRSAWEAYETTMDKFARDPELNDLTEIQCVTTGRVSAEAAVGLCAAALPLR